MEFRSNYSCEKAGKMRAVLILYGIIVTLDTPLGKSTSQAARELTKINYEMFPQLKGRLNRLNEFFENSIGQISSDIDRRLKYMNKTVSELKVALNLAMPEVKSDQPEEESGRILKGVRDTLNKLQQIDSKVVNDVRSFFPKFQKHINLAQGKGNELYQAFETVFSKGTKCQRELHDDFSKIYYKYENVFTNCTGESVHAIKRYYAAYDLLERSIAEESRAYYVAIPKIKSLVKRVLSVFHQKVELSATMLVNEIETSVRSWLKSLNSVCHETEEGFNAVITATPICFVACYKNLLKDWTKQTIDFKYC